MNQTGPLSCVRAIALSAAVVLYVLAAPAEAITNIVANASRVSVAEPVAVGDSQRYYRVLAE